MYFECKSYFQSTSSMHSSAAAGQGFQSVLLQTQVLSSVTFVVKKAFVIMLLIRHSKICILLLNVDLLIAIIWIVQIKRCSSYIFSTN